MARAMKKYGKTLKTFSVGINKDSTDLGWARKVADHIGSEHHEVLFTVEEGLAILEELIWKLETYDITTIRASTPMYIMSRYIRKQGVKVVLSGEGADEIFGGYLYFTNAPSAKDFHEECLRRVKLLNTSDVLRVDRSTMGHGIEARVPFLDKAFLEAALALEPELKTITPGVRMEKYVLRKAFDDAHDPLLPKEVLWRQKEQFSDGVGYSWIDTLKAHAEKVVSDEDFAKRAELYPHNTPVTKEAFFYRTIYASLFTHPRTERLVQMWVPKWQTNLDPSGRANKAHEAYQGGPTGPEARA
jgi:asparagine synthase (glutamine-hydrolysing)